MAEVTDKQTDTFYIHGVVEYAGKLSISHHSIISTFALVSIFLLMFIENLHSLLSLHLRSCET